MANRNHLWKGGTIFRWFYNEKIHQITLVDQNIGKQVLVVQIFMIIKIKCTKIWRICIQNSVNKKSLKLLVKNTVSLRQTYQLPIPGLTWLKIAMTCPPTTGRKWEGSTSQDFFYHLSCEIIFGKELCLEWSLLHFWSLWKACRNRRQSSLSAQDPF